MNINDEFRNQAISHAHYLERLKTGEVRRLIKLTNAIDRDLVNRLMSYDDADERFTKRRLDAILRDVRSINEQAVAELNIGLRGSIQDLAEYEAGFQARRLSSTIPIDWNISQPSPQQLMTAVLNRPFENALFDQHVENLGSSKLRKLEGVMRMGQVEGETIAQIARRIRGSRAAKYEDGILAGTRREIESLVRTSLNHSSSVSRERTFAENSDLIKGVQMVATLDNQTTLICMDQDGKVYPIGEGPRPPFHWSCRTSPVPVLRSWKELGLDIDEVPPGTRASMNGQVSEKITYPAWLKSQSPEQQREILGARRYEMYRNGTPIDRFVRDGRVLTIQELERLEKKAA